MKILTGSEWRSYDFTGQSVAVVVPADLAADIVPAVVRTARAVKVFQQEPAWVAPLGVPVVRNRLARLHLRLTIKDAWTRRLLTPTRFGRRDVLISPEFYRALQQPHCKLIAWPVYAIVPHGVRTAEGIEHRVDCIIVSHALKKELAA